MLLLGASLTTSTSKPNVSCLLPSWLFSMNTVLPSSASSACFLVSSSFNLFVSPSACFCASSAALCFAAFAAASPSAAAFSAARFSASSAFAAEHLYSASLRASAKLPWRSRDFFVSSVFPTVQNSSCARNVQRKTAAAFLRIRY